MRFIFIYDIYDIYDIYGNFNFFILFTNQKFAFNAFSFCDIRNGPELSLINHVRVFLTISYHKFLPS